MATSIDPQTGTPTDLPSAEVYDFLHPQRIPREQWIALEALSTKLAEALQGLFAARLRQSVTVTRNRLEEVTLTDAITALGNPCTSYIFDPGDGSGTTGILDLGGTTASYIVDRLLGGPGSVPDATRPITSIEQRVLKGVVERTLALIGETLSESGKVKPTVAAFESAGERISEAVSADALVLATFEVAGEQSIGTVTLLIPLPTVVNVLQEKRAPAVKSTRGTVTAKQDTKANLEAAVRHARVPLMVRFPAITLPARAVAMMSAGQIIQTALPLDIPLEVRVNGRLRFLGAPGQVHGTVGVRIVRTVPVENSAATVPTRARIT